MSGMATALCAAISIESGEAAPEWLHLLPAGEVRTHDRRGPYRVADTAALIAASMAGGKLVLDENHSTDLAAPRGEAAPARGWITDLEARPDGVWGRVEWTEEARRQSLHQSYRGVSPAILHSKDGTIAAILRASLTNTPNFRGLVALHSKETSMDFRAWLIEALGLAADASDEAIVAAMKKKIEAPEATTALQSVLAPIAAAAGLPENSDAAAVLAGVQQMRVGGDEGAITALQSELVDTTNRLNTLIESNARREAETFVDAAIAAGRIGVKPQRDRYISMHMRDRVEAVALINALPAVKGGATLGGTPETAADGVDEAGERVIALMGISRADYVASLAEQGKGIAA